MGVDLSVFGRQKSVLDYQQLQQAFEQKKALQLAQLGALQSQAQKEASGGNLPAALQIANEYQKARAEGNTQKMNDIELFTKSFEKGILSNGGQPMQAPAVGGMSRGNPNAEMSFPEDNGFFEPDRPSFGVQPIAGYGAASGSISATKKGLEQDAKNTSDLQFKPVTAERVAASSVLGKSSGEKEELLRSFEASMPELLTTVGDLSGLSETATFTKAGQIGDSILKEMGIATQGGTDRAAYIATIDNIVLPRLRETFGAAFTVAEGEKLTATLGNPDSTPAAKNAALNAFIAQKFANIREAQRYLGKEVTETVPPTFGGDDAAERAAFEAERARRGL